MKRMHALLCLLGLAGGAIALYQLFPDHPAVEPPGDEPLANRTFPLPPFSESRFLNTGPDTRYVGTAACAVCMSGATHGIVDSRERTKGSHNRQQDRPRTQRLPPRQIEAGNVKWALRGEGLLHRRKVLGATLGKRESEHFRRDPPPQIF